jgi:hypothetical protein
VESMFDPAIRKKRLHDFWEEVGYPQKRLCSEFRGAC